MRRGFAVWTISTPAREGFRLRGLEAVVQDGGSPPGPGRAVCRQAGEQAKGRRELGDLGFSGEQDFPD
jgi:hypothetical protein